MIDWPHHTTNLFSNKLNQLITLEYPLNYQTNNIL
jgi:hypothetical protein